HINGHGFAIGIGKGIGAVTVINKRSSVGIKNHFGSIHCSMGESSVSIIHQFIGILKNNINDFVIDIALVLDIGDHIANYINKHACSVGIGKGVRTVTIIYVCGGVGVKNYNRTINCSVRKCSVSVIY